MKSITVRIRAATLVTTALLLAGILALNHWLLGDVLEDFVAARLEHDAEALLAAWEVAPSGSRSLDSSFVNPVYRQPLSGHYYRIDSDGQVLYSRSLWDERLPAPPTSNPSGTSRRVPGPGGQDLLLITTAYRKSDHELVISVAEDLGPLRAGLVQLQQASAVLIVGLALLTLAAQQLAIRRGLAPLGRAQEQLRQLQLGELTSLDEEAPREVLPLVREINRLGGVLEQRLQRSRSALGNLAHGIKTPLTALQRLLEAPALTEQPALRGELKKQLLRIRELTERELRRARIAGGATLGQRVALRSEVESLVQVMKQVYFQKPLSIELRIADNMVLPCDRDDLVELLGNLMDNACKWARSRVQVSANTDAAACDLRIEDDGPGIPLQQSERLLRRGVRLDEFHEGHGLGLAIVSDIVSQYGGSLTLAQSATLGGLDARVRLPCVLPERVPAPVSEPASH